MADMGILANFRQAGAAGQGAWRLYYMGKANQRAEEQHQQQSEMNEMKMQQEQQKMQQQQELEKMRQDMLNAKTPDEMEKLKKRQQILDPDGALKMQTMVNNASKNQLMQIDITNKMTGQSLAAIEALRKDPNGAQKAEAIWQNLQKNINKSLGNNAPANIPLKDAVQNGYYQKVTDQYMMSEEMLKNKKLQSEIKLNEKKVGLTEAQTDLYQFKAKGGGVSGKQNMQRTNFLVTDKNGEQKIVGGYFDKTSGKKYIDQNGKLTELKGGEPFAGIIGSQDPTSLGNLISKKSKQDAADMLPLYKDTKNRLENFVSLISKNPADTGLWGQAKTVVGGFIENTAAQFGNEAGQEWGKKIAGKGPEIVATAKTLAAPIGKLIINMRTNEKMSNIDYLEAKRLLNVIETTGSASQAVTALRHLQSILVRYESIAKEKINQKSSGKKLKYIDAESGKEVYE